MMLKILEDKENTNFFKISKSNKLHRKLMNLRIHLSGAKVMLIVPFKRNGYFLRKESRPSPQ